MNRGVNGPGSAPVADALSPVHTVHTLDWKQGGPEEVVAIEKVVGNWP